MFGHWKIKISNINLNILLIWFTLVGWSNFDSSSIGGPIHFKLFCCIWNCSTIVVDIKIISCFVIYKVKETVFQGNSSDFIFNYPDRLKFFCISKRTNQGLKIWLVHPRLEISYPKNFWTLVRVRFHLL